MQESLASVSAKGGHWGQVGVSAVPEENPCYLIYFLMSFLDMALLCVF